MRLLFFALPPLRFRTKNTKSVQKKLKNTLFRPKFKAEHRISRYRMGVVLNEGCFSVQQKGPPFGRPFEYAVDFIERG